METSLSTPETGRPKSPTNAVTSVKEIKTVSSGPDSVIWERPEGRVRVDRVGNRNRVTLEPFDKPRQTRFAVHHETAYPLDLIESIVRAKEFATICDEMRRDEAEDYVSRNLKESILTYCPAGEFKGKRLLDFGCGMGASTMRLAKMLPETQIVGIELESYLIDIARKRKDFYGADNVTLLQSPSADSLPPNLGTFDCVVFSALFEHLLPHERKALLPVIWNLLRPRGVLFVSETPHRWHFKESHTTQLMFLNYLPDRVALWSTRKFCRRYPGDVGWEFLLREGIRGGTVSEILAILKTQSGKPQLLHPIDGSDAIDCWLKTTNTSKSKRIMARAFKVLKALTGITFTPMVQLAIRRAAI
jgi:2-polyprenyl-3-methyl-5-hydroxy-6-metoxy-1,4-benzoquinol methylase